MLPTAKLEHILCWVLENPHSDFYREKFAGRDAIFPLTPKRWETLPFLLREEITGTPFWRRV
jgi:hypothetical protein